MSSGDLHDSDHGFEKAPEGLRPMEPVLDLSPLRERVDAEAFALFLERLQEECRFLIHLYRPEDAEFLECRILPEGQIHIVNLTQKNTVSWKNAVLFDIPPDQLRRIYDGAISRACGFESRERWAPEQQPKITPADIGQYIATHRAALEQVVARRKGPKPGPFKRLFGSRRVPDDLLREPAREQLAEQQRSRREEREQARFQERIFTADPRYNLARHIPIMFEEHMEGRKIRRANALVVDRKSLVPHGPPIRLLIINENDVSGGGDIHEETQRATRIASISGMRTAQGKDAVHVGIAKGKDNIPSLEVVLFWDAAPVDVVLHGVRFAIGTLTTEPQSAEGQSWTVEGLHIDASKAHVFLSDRFARGALVDWRAKSGEGHDEPED